MQSKQNRISIGFIGGGNMARALIGGLAKSADMAASIHVVDPNPGTLRGLADDFGVSTAPAIDARLQALDVLVLAVKPQQLRDVAGELAPHLQRQFLLSIAAGIRTADLARWSGGYEQIVRCMPNTPALIGKGITALYALAGVSAAQRQAAETIMAAVGQTLWLQDEQQLDAVTAVSGSGPAYVFYFIEAMQAAAAELGLDPQQSTQLALATFAGAAQLALGSAEPVSVLRERVTSKGGTTYAALCSLEQNQVKTAIVAAIQAAAARSRELGDELGK